MNQATHFRHEAHVADQGGHGDHVDEGDPGGAGRPAEVFPAVGGHVCGGFVSKGALFTTLLEFSLALFLSFFLSFFLSVFHFLFLSPAQLSRR